MQASETYESTLARLHLKAVLPTVAALVRKDEHARSLMFGESFALQLSIMGGLSTRLDFGQERIEVDSGRLEPDPLQLLFLTNRQLNNAFTGKGVAVPIPTKGFRHLGAIRAFSRLTQRLRDVLNPTPESLCSMSLLAVHVDLLFGELIPRAIRQLAECEPVTRHWLDDYIGSTAWFRVNGGPSSWVRITGDQVMSGSGVPRETADVVVTFRDRQVALSAIKGELDNLAALGKGQMSISGLIPLADALDRVVDRVTQFLRS